MLMLTSVAMLLSGELISQHTFVFSCVIAIVALWMDKLLGEPRYFHPLVGFGHYVNWVEKYSRKLTLLSPQQQGILAWLLAVMPITLFTLFLQIKAAQSSLGVFLLFNSVIVYLTLGGKSLLQHADNIYRPLKDANIEQARYQVSMIVSRNTEKMTEKEIASSAIESVLENGNDAVFAPLLWFLILGAPGAVLFRLANTLDAMWGYKNSRYLHFGSFSAKVDDALAWFPARLTALIYALQGNFKQAIDCWQKQAKRCNSPNGGVVMTAGAGALNIIIGGPTYYHGVLHDKKPMGCGQEATWQAIPLANQLVTKGSFAFGYSCLIIALVGMN